MTYQRDPDPRRPRRYSLREDGGSVAAPVLVAAALIGFIGYLLLGPGFDQPSDQPSKAPRVELPNTNPAAPPVPTPAPQQPQ